MNKLQPTCHSSFKPAALKCEIFALSQFVKDYNQTFMSGCSVYDKFKLCLKSTEYLGIEIGRKQISTLLRLLIKKIPCSWTNNL